MEDLKLRLHLAVVKEDLQSASPRSLAGATLEWGPEWNGWQNIAAKLGFEGSEATACVRRAWLLLAKEQESLFTLGRLPLYSGSELAEVLGLAMSNQRREKGVTSVCRVDARVDQPRLEDQVPDEPAHAYWDPLAADRSCVCKFVWNCLSVPSL